MAKNWRKKLWQKFIERPAKFTLLLALGLLSAIGLYLLFAAHNIHKRFDQLHTEKASDFFGSYPSLKENQRLTVNDLEQILEDAGMVKVSDLQDLLAGKFFFEKSGDNLVAHIYRNDFSAPGRILRRLQVRMELRLKEAPLYEIRSIERQDNRDSLDFFELPPKKIASYMAGRVRTQSFYPLSEIPVSMRLAVMAIEDAKFLEHKGISLRAIARALWRDLRAGRFVEGGSTITQQLMKNLFFSREKSILRKISEAVYAILAEAMYSKETILEAYLNEVYLGQLSTHQIHGIPEGARYYFNAHVSDLNLTQSALLAAIIQLPNLHDPRRSPERALNRRNLVLRRMAAVGFILEEEASDAAKTPLGIVPKDRSLEDIDYFIDLVLESMPSHLRASLDSQQLTIYTTLNPYMQNAASLSLKENIARLEKSYKTLKTKAEKGLKLQGALIAIDVPNCSVWAMQGGQSYRQTQFNRVLQGKRQPGSLLKPFVYLTAFSKQDIDPPITADTMLEDSPLEWKYDNQTWTPKNYDDEFRGPVTVRQALEDSLNVPTAKLAQMVTLPPIVETMKHAGITSPLTAVPSISLGSAEVTPFELARAYTTLANVGKRCEPNPIHEIFDTRGNLLLHTQPNFENELDPVGTEETNEVLKGVLTRGTAKWVASLNLPTQDFSGKTGTTNEYKDAWFVGYSNQVLILVWMGYDEEEKIGLTGAAAALPVWVDFFRRSQFFYNAANG